MEVDNINLVQQIRFILSTHFQGKYKETSQHFNFRCNVCGDGTSKHKKRGFILKGKNPIIYYCHNCKASMTAIRWMKTYYPQSYREYISEQLKNNKPKVEQIPEIEVYKEKDDLKFFIPILKGKTEIFQKAIQQCEERLIPIEVYSKWYVCTGGDNFKNRMIIPYFDNKGKVYNYQGRAINKQIPKYNSRKSVYRQYNNIYNFFNVNRDNPVIIFEGVINSLFVENSVAITGIKRTSDAKLLEFDQRYFIVDADATGYEKSLRLLEAGEYVFLWKQFILDFKLPIREKWDFNDVAIFLNKKDKWTFKELEKYFTNSIYRQLEFI